MKKGRGHTPGVFVTHKEGWQHKPIKYTTLTINHIKKGDRDLILKDTAKLTTGVQAQDLVRQQEIDDKFTRWSCRTLDLRGNVVVLLFQGIEVVLFFRRQITEITPQAGEPIPEVKMEDPNDAWVRCDLIGLSASQARRIVSSRAVEQEELIETMKKEISAKDSLVSRYETEKFVLTGEIDSLKDRIKKLVTPPEKKKKKKVVKGKKK